jgi:hypothetical protein
VTDTQISLTGRLFDTASDDREVEVAPGMAMPKKNQLLWIDTSRDPADLERAEKALGLDGALGLLARPGSRPRSP